MAKFGKFISTKSVAFTKTEIDEFVKRLSALVKRYDEEVKIKCLCSEYDDRLMVSFKSKPKALRNLNGSRIEYKGLYFVLFKNKGYIENYDWCKMEIIDKTKPQRDFESAPPFQYSVYLRVDGSEIPYRHRTKEGIAPKSSFQYGTEFDDIDFSESIRELYERQLRAK